MNILIITYPPDPPVMTTSLLLNSLVPTKIHRSGPSDADHPRDQSHPTCWAPLHGGAAKPETAPGSFKCHGFHGIHGSFIRYEMGFVCSKNGWKKCDSSTFLMGFFMAKMRFGCVDFFSDHWRYGGQRPIFFLDHSLGSWSKCWAVEFTLWLCRNDAVVFEENLILILILDSNMMEKTYLDTYI